MANQSLQKQPQRNTLGNVVVLSGTTSLSALGYGKLTIQASKGMRCLKEKRSGSGGSWRRTSRFRLNQKKQLSAGPWARWPNNFRHLRRIWRRIISRKGKRQSSLETLQSRRTTGMPLWHISLQSLGFGTWKRPRKMPPRKYIITL